MSMSCSLMPPFDETVDGQIFTVFWDCLNYSYVIFVYSSFLLSGGAVVQWLRHHFWHTTQLLSHLPVVHCLVMKAPMTSGARQLFRPDALPAWCHQWVIRRLWASNPANLCLSPTVAVWVIGGGGKGIRPALLLSASESVYLSARHVPALEQWSQRR